MFIFLTPKGVSEKTKLTINFMKRKAKNMRNLKIKNRQRNKITKMWTILKFNKKKFAFFKKGHFKQVRKRCFYFTVLKFKLKS